MGEKIEYAKAELRSALNRLAIAKVDVLHARESVRYAREKERAERQASKHEKKSPRPAKNLRKTAP